MTQETFVPWFQKENTGGVKKKTHLAWQIAGREKKASGSVGL